MVFFVCSDGAVFFVCSDGVVFFVCSDGAVFFVCSDGVVFFVCSDGVVFFVCSNGMVFFVFRFLQFNQGGLWNISFILTQRSWYASEGGIQPFKIIISLWDVK